MNSVCQNGECFQDPYQNVNMTVIFETTALFMYNVFDYVKILFETTHDWAQDAYQASDMVLWFFIKMQQIPWVWMIITFMACFVLIYKTRHLWIVSLVSIFVYPNPMLHYSIAFTYTIVLVAEFLGYLNFNRLEHVKSCVDAEKRNKMCNMNKEDVADVVSTDIKYNAFTAAYRNVHNCVRTFDYWGLATHVASVASLFSVTCAVMFFWSVPLFTIVRSEKFTTLRKLYNPFLKLESKNIAPDFSGLKIGETNFVDPPVDNRPSGVAFVPPVLPISSDVTPMEVPVSTSPEQGIIQSIQDDPNLSFSQKLDLMFSSEPSTQFQQVLDDINRSKYGKSFFQQTAEVTPLELIHNHHHAKVEGVFKKIPSEDVLILCQAAKRNLAVLRLNPDIDLNLLCKEHALVESVACQHRTIKPLSEYEQFLVLHYLHDYIDGRYLAVGVIKRQLEDKLGLTKEQFKAYNGYIDNKLRLLEKGTHVDPSGGDSNVNPDDLHRRRKRYQDDSDYDFNIYSLIDDSFEELSEDEEFPGYYSIGHPVPGGPKCFRAGRGREAPESSDGKSVDSNEEYNRLAITDQFVEVPIPVRQAEILPEGDSCTTLWEIVPGRTPEPRHFKEASNGFWKELPKSQESLGVGRITKEPNLADRKKKSDLLNAQKRIECLHESATLESIKASNLKNVNMSETQVDIEWYYDEKWNFQGFARKVPGGMLMPAHLFDKEFPMRFNNGHRQEKINISSPVHVFGKVNYIGLFDFLIVVETTCNLCKCLSINQIEPLTSVKSACMVTKKGTPPGIVTRKGDTVLFTGSTEGGDCGGGYFANNNLVAVHAFGGGKADNAGLAITEEMMNYFRDQVAASQKIATTVHKFHAHGESNKGKQEVPEGPRSSGILPKKVAVQTAPKK